MNREILKTMAENLDKIIDIYKGVKSRDRQEIENHIKQAIKDIKVSENLPPKTRQQVSKAFLSISKGSRE